jgi:hypothetical protein
MRTWEIGEYDRRSVKVIRFWGQSVFHFQPIITGYSQVSNFAKLKFRLISIKALCWIWGKGDAEFTCLQEGTH